MILEKVVIQNFLSIQKATVYLKNRGLVSIEGVNLDPQGTNSNGSGKSSLINAILWCNYGDSGKDLKADQVVNNKAGKDCMVACYWFDEIVGKQYIVTRYRKDKTFKDALLIYSDGVNLSRGTNPETQALIFDILGQDKETFEASCFARQEDAPDIPGMTDGELKSLLERVLPFESLNSKAKKASENLTSHLKIYEDLKRRSSNLEDKISFTLDQIAIEETAIEDWEESSKRRAEATKRKLVDLEEAIAAKRASIKPDDKVSAAYNKFFKASLEFSQVEYSKLQAEFRLAGKTMNEAKRNLHDIDKLTSCQTCGQAIADRNTTLEAFKATYQESTDEYERLASEMAVADLKWHEYSDNVSKCDRIKEIRQQNELAKRELIGLEANLRQLQERTEDDGSNPHVATKNRLVDVLAGLNEQMVALGVDLTAAHERTSVLEAVLETVSPAGVRYHILETVTPALNEYTNYYLSQLTDGTMKANWSTVTKLKNGSYKEKFSIAISGDGFTSYGSLSGGEKRKVKLACFFALQDLIAKRATKTISLWCGDEIDNALDEAGMERLMSLLHEKAKTKHTILVISHNELREWIPNFTTVVKKDKISTIMGYLSE